MPEPISFPTATSTFSLPLLFAGQAQKEFFVNQSLTLIDSLMQQCVEATHSSPPQEALEGQPYLVGDEPTSDWADREGNIAVLIGGIWQFTVPFDGMRVFDRAASQDLVYRSGWQFATAPAEVQGGSVVDVEARSAIAELSQALRNIGILGEPV